MPDQEFKNEKGPAGQKIPRPMSRKSSKAKQRRLFWLGLGLGGVAMISATAGALLAVSLSSTPLLQRKLSAQEAAIFDSDRISTSSLRLPELTRPVNILVLGMSVLSADVQHSSSETRNLSYQPQVNSLDGLSDTMLMVRFNPEAKKLNILSIPRDTRVIMENYGAQKINIANVKGGPALTAKVASDLLQGVGIDRYVRINVLGVGKLVDALGGLTIYIPRDMKYKDDTQHLYINLKQGKHHLKGDQVMQLLRFRNDKLGDIGRIQRQQMVMRALMEQALNPTTLARIPQLLSVVQSHIDTNLTVEELIALLGFAARIERSNVQMLMLPGDYSGAEYQGVSYWLPSRRAIEVMMAQHFDQGYGGAQYSDPSQIRISIQDSTDNKVAVRTLIKTLAKAGYRNVYIDSAWTEPLNVTRVLAQKGDKKGAQSIQESLGLGEVRVESTGNISSDITIVVGKDWVEKQPSSQTLNTR